MRVMCAKSNTGRILVCTSSAKSVGRSAAASRLIAVSTSPVSALISTSGRAAAGGGCACAFRATSTSTAASTFRIELFLELQIVRDRAHAADRAGDLYCLAHVVLV